MFYYTLKLPRCCCCVFSLLFYYYYFTFYVSPLLYDIYVCWMQLWVFSEPVQFIFINCFIRLVEQQFKSLRTSIYPAASDKGVISLGVNLLLLIIQLRICVRAVILS